MAIVVLAMLPARVGYLDFLAPRPSPGGSLPAHLIASPFGTVDATIFRLWQPVGTAVAAGGGAKGMEVNRTLKGPRLPRSAGPPATPDDEGPWSAPARPPGVARAVGPAAGSRETGDGTLAFLMPTSLTPAYSQEPSPDWSERWPDRPWPGEPPSSGSSSSGSSTAGSPATGSSFADLSDDDWPDDEAAPDGVAPSADSGAFMIGRARYDFTAAPSGGAAPLAPWPQDDAGEGPREGTGEPDTVPSPPDNVTVARKRQADRRPDSPAGLLGLAGARRARQEKCLADAVYFEARGEPVRGQMAVAQVVLNRVFSGYYPGNVCDVVYQHTRHRRCQFSFTCDGIPDRVSEPEAWQRATRIARDALDGDFWLDDVGKATHYHARWVHPWWVHEMRRLDRIGVHTFYRPRRWGDGERSPVWGDAQTTAAAAAAL